MAITWPRDLHILEYERCLMKTLWTIALLLAVPLLLFYSLFLFNAFHPGGRRMGVPFISPKLAIAAMGEDAFPNRTKDADFCTNNVAFHDAKSHTLHVGILPTDFEFSVHDKELFSTVGAVVFEGTDGKIYQYDVVANQVFLAPSEQFEDLEPNLVAISVNVQPWDLGFFKIRDSIGLIALLAPDDEVIFLRRRRLSRRRLTWGIETPKDIQFPIVEGLFSQVEFTYCEFLPRNSETPRYLVNYHRLPRFNYYNGRFYTEDRLSQNPWESIGDRQGGWELWPSYYKQQRLLRESNSNSSR